MPQESGKLLEEVLVEALREGQVDFETLGPKGLNTCPLGTSTLLGS